MGKIDRAIRDISDMYDIWLDFRQAKIEAGLPVTSPIPGMSPEEFEQMRVRSIGTVHRNHGTREKTGRDSRDPIQR